MPRRTVAATLIIGAGVLPLVGAVLGWDRYLDGPVVLLHGAAAGYAAGAWLTRAPAAAGVLLAVGGLVTAHQVHGTDFHWLDDTVFFLVAVGGPCVAGAIVTARARQVRHLDLLLARLEEQQAADVAAARLDEQTRVHRELHAGLAERIAGIAVQAEGARRVADADVLGQIEQEARDVLDRLRTALGSLRGADDVPVTVAQSAGARALGSGTLPVTPAAAAQPRPSWADLVLAATLGAALAVETLLVGGSPAPAWVVVLAAPAAAAPLVVRRARPVAAVAATTLGTVLLSAWVVPVALTVTGVALLTVVFYTVGAWCRGRWWVAGFLVAATGTVATGLVSDQLAQLEHGDGAWALVAWVVGATLLGRVAAGWQSRLRRTAETFAALEESRGAAVRLARARERQALAAQLHDTVAHAMTVVCLQAGAQRRCGGDPGASLATIAGAATAGLGELRDGLDSIEQGAHPLSPSAITAIGRRVGVDVDVSGTVGPAAGPVVPLVLRLLRETLVNVARHAPGARAQVHLASVGDGLAVAVHDDGGRGDPLTVGAGAGLRGLQDAVVSAGGAMEWGPGPDGGFHVFARIPQGSP